MRDLIELLTHVKNLADKSDIKDCKAFIHKVDDLIDSLYYTAPEIMYLRWEQAQHLMDIYIDKKYSDIWEYWRNASAS